MIIDARQIAKETHYVDFEFVGMDGEKYSLPGFGSLTITDLNTLSRFDIGAPDAEDPFNGLFGVDAYEALKSMPILVATQILSMWQKAAGDEVKKVSQSAGTPKFGQRSAGTSPRAGGTRKKSH